MNAQTTASLTNPERNQSVSVLSVERMKLLWLCLLVYLAGTTVPTSWTVKPVLNRMIDTNFYKNTAIPILMISGDRDELFPVNKIEETFSMITNPQKELTFLEGDTHTSVIWHAGPYIEGWMSKISGNE